MINKKTVKSSSDKIKVYCEKEQKKEFKWEYYSILQKETEFKSESKMIVFLYIVYAQFYA